MTTKIIQFQNGLKGLRKSYLNTKSKNDKEKAKKVKHLTLINLKGITKGTPESDIHTYISLDRLCVLKAKISSFCVDFVHLILT